jgi:hypothetical protein
MMTKKSYNKVWEEVFADVEQYGNGFVHVSKSKIRRIDPLELLKKAADFTKQVIEPKRGKSH